MATSPQGGRAARQDRRSALGRLFTPERLTVDGNDLACATSALRRATPPSLKGAAWEACSTEHHDAGTSGDL